MENKFINNWSKTVHRNCGISGSALFGSVSRDVRYELHKNLAIIKGNNFTSVHVT